MQTRADADEIRKPLQTNVRVRELPYGAVLVELTRAHGYDTHRLSKDTLGECGHGRVLVEQRRGQRRLLRGRGRRVRLVEIARGSCKRTQAAARASALGLQRARYSHGTCFRLEFAPTAAQAVVVQLRERKMQRSWGAGCDRRSALHFSAHAGPREA